jgi:hypothetical protein
MNPFDPIPNAWAEAAVFIIALAFLGYGLWVIWPWLEVAWLLVFW